MALILLLDKINEKQAQTIPSILKARYFYKSSHQVDEKCQLRSHLNSQAYRDSGEYRKHRFHCY